MMTKDQNFEYNKLNRITMNEHKESDSFSTIITALMLFSVR